MKYHIFLEHINQTYKMYTRFSRNSLIYKPFIFIHSNTWTRVEKQHRKGRPLDYMLTSHRNVCNSSIYTAKWINELAGKSGIFPSHMWTWEKLIAAFRKDRMWALLSKGRPHMTSDPQSMSQDTRFMPWPQILQLCLV